MLLRFLALALPVAAQSSSTPWDILSSRTIVAPFLNMDEAGSALAPNGDLFVAANPCGAPGTIKLTGTYGTPSQCDTVVSRIDSVGNAVFAIQLAGVDDGGPSLLLDAAGNVFIAGQTNSPSRFTATPGAYLTTAPQSVTTGFVCKLAAADGVPIFCSFLDVAANIFTLDASGGLLFTQVFASTPAQTLYSIHELDPTGAKLLLQSVPFNALLNQIVPSADGTFYVGGVTPSASFYGKFDPGTGFLFTLDFPSNASFSIALQPSGGPVLAGNFGSGYEVRQYALDGKTIVYDRSLAFFSGEKLSVVNGGVVLEGLGTSAALPLLHNLHPCGQMLTPYSAGPMMIRLDQTGAIVQTTWLGTSTFFSLIENTDGGWSALGSATEDNPTSSNLSFQVLSIGPNPSAQPQSIGCMADLAQGTNYRASPGLLVALTLENNASVGPATAQPDSNGRFPTSLAGITVTFDGVPAPLFAWNGNQLSMAVPFSVASRSASQMCVASVVLAASCTIVDVTPFSPSAFPTVTNEDGTINSASNPARPGSIVSFYMVGLGALSPPVPDGTIVGLPLPGLANQVQVEFATGFANEAGPFSPAPPPAIAEVTYAGAAAFEVAGLYQINARVPASVLGNVTLAMGPLNAPVATTQVNVSVSSQ